MRRPRWHCRSRSSSGPGEPSDLTRPKRQGKNHCQTRAAITITTAAASHHPSPASALRGFVSTYAANPIPPWFAPLPSVESPPPAVHERGSAGLSGCGGMPPEEGKAPGSPWRERVAAPAHHRERCSRRSGFVQPATILRAYCTPVKFRCGREAGATFHVGNEKGEREGREALVSCHYATVQPRVWIWPPSLQSR